MKKLNLFGKNILKDLIVVAEIGINHEGDINKSYEIVKSLENSGISAVKFQSYNVDNYVAKGNKKRRVMLKRFNISIDDLYNLKKEANNIGIALFSTPLTQDMVKPLSEFCDVIKIASGDINFFPTISNAIKTDLPVIVSTGAAEIHEIDKTVEFFLNAYGKEIISQKLILMHCVSEYPAELKNCNLKSINYMRER